MATQIIIKSNDVNLFDNEWPRQVILELNVTPDIVTNTSKVDWVLRADGTNTARSLRWTIEELWIEDEIIYTCVNETVYSQQVIATGTTTVPHNLDGSKSLGAKLDGYLDYFGALYTTRMIYFDSYIGDPLYTYVDLPVIPRTSTVTCTTVEVGRNPIITINSPSTTFTHTLRYQFGSLSGTIIRGIAAGAYSGWSIPTSFLNQITNAKYGEGTIYCDTYSRDGSLNGTSTTTFRVNVPSLYGPTLSPTVKNIDSKTLALTGDENKIVQYFNKVEYDVGAFTTSGATIKSQNVTCGGQSASTMTGTLTNVESNAFKFSATDSRGFTTTETLYATMVPYIKLTAKLQLVSMDTTGTGRVAISGNLFWGSFGRVENQPVVSYRHKTQGGTWSNWIDVVYNIINDSYYADIEFQGLDYQETYIYQARAADQLMTVETSELVVRCMPVFDWNNDDFQFNVPVTISGNLVVNGTITSASGSGSQSNPGVDYVIETGESDIWTYRKWSSGAAECWGTIAPTSHSITGTWGSIYTKDNAIPRTYYPFEFIDVPVVSMTLYNTTGNCWYYTGTQGTALQTPAFGLARGTSGSVTTGAQITAIGRWK